MGSGGPSWEPRTCETGTLPMEPSSHFCHLFCGHCLLLHPIYEVVSSVSRILKTRTLWLMDVNHPSTQGKSPELESHSATFTPCQSDWRSHMKALSGAVSYYKGRKAEGTLSPKSLEVAASGCCLGPSDHPFLTGAV
jgi:hypothetical protein